MTQVGDLVYLKSVLTNVHWYGVVTDPNSPNQFSATMEVYGDDGVLTTNALVGPRGAAGQPQFALRLEQDIFTDPLDLPILTNTVADVGKYWLISNTDSNGNLTGTTAYIWYGTEYRQMMMGSIGPPGPYPIITPTVALVDPDTTISSVDVTGTIADPSWQLNLAVPAGPPGPSATLHSCPDVDETTNPPTVGQVLGFNGRHTGGGLPIWEPLDIGDIMPSPYTIPESAFTSYVGITLSNVTICTWTAPAQAWDWKPFVWGQLKVFGAEIDAQPLLIGAEVRMGSPSGTLIGRGFGNSFGSVTIVPHTSSPGTTSAAMTPANSLGKVLAGTTTTLYVNLTNDGLASAFDFQSADAQLSVLVLPNGIELAGGS